MVFRIRWKLRSPNVTSTASCWPRPQWSTWPGSRVAASQPSTTTSAGYSPIGTIDTDSSESSTKERSKSMCGATGVRICTLARGETIGPRADRLYAVDPVGVARMIESDTNVRNGSPFTTTVLRIVRPGVVRCSTTSFSRAPAKHDVGPACPVGRRDVERHPFLDQIFPGQETFERVAKSGRLDRAQVAELAQVDTEHWHVRLADQVHGPQHRAVSAEAHGKVERTQIRRAAVGGDREHRDFVAFASQPCCGLLRKGDRPGTLSVRYEDDPGHQRAPAGDDASATASSMASAVLPSAAGTPPPADEVGEELDVSVGAAQRGDHETHNARSCLLERGGYGGEATPPDFGIAYHTAAPGRLLASGLELRFDQHHQVRARGRERQKRVRNAAKRNERQIRDDQRVGASGGFGRAEIPDVGPVDLANPRVAAHALVELAAADVDRGHRHRSVLQEAIGEASSRSSCIEGAAPGRVHPEAGQCGLELESSPADVARRGRGHHHRFTTAHEP